MPILCQFYSQPKYGFNGPSSLGCRGGARDFSPSSPCKSSLSVLLGISEFDKLVTFSRTKKLRLGCDIRGNGVIVCLLFSMLRANATNLYRSVASFSVQAYFSMHPHDRKRSFVPGD